MQNLDHLATVNLTPSGRVLQMTLNICVYLRVSEEFLVTLASFWPVIPDTKFMVRNYALSPVVIIAVTRPVEL